MKCPSPSVPVSVNLTPATARAVAKTIHNIGIEPWAWLHVVAESRVLCTIYAGTQLTPPAKKRSRRQMRVRIDRLLYLFLQDMATSWGFEQVGDLIAMTLEGFHQKVGVIDRRTVQARTG
jgi:hypothetical protein